jgi:ubiquinone/menaquinone biosynthesis C-methylase UbiE
MKSVFDTRAAEYDAWYDRNRAVYLSELSAVRKVLPQGKKGLEIGAGTGRFAASLGIGTGIDPSRNMLKLAQKRGVDVRVGFGEEMPFKNGTFDYVAIIITLCFVKNPKKVLEESFRVLRKNGRIIIGIVDKESFLGKYYLKKKSVFYKQANFLSVNEVTELLKESGFLGFSYYQTISTLPDEVRSVEKPKKGFGKGGFVVISSAKR